MGRSGQDVRRSVSRWVYTVCVVPTGLLLAVGAGGLGAQEPLSIEHFDGWKEWPLFEPGDLEIDGDALGSHRTWMDFVAPSGEVTTMHVDVTSDVFFRGEPAAWIEHTGYGSAGDTTGITSLDTHIVNRETFRVQFRVAAGPGGRTWAGPYDITQHFPDGSVRTSVKDDGSVEQNRVSLDENNPFDFVTMPYVVALAGLLEEGRRFRLLNIGSMRDPEPRPVGLLVQGRTTMTDANGVEREVWHVQLISNAEHLLVDLQISEEPPYFMGWRFRSVATGRTGVRTLYRHHVELPRN